MQQHKASGNVVVTEDGTHSKEDIALFADGHTHYTDVWVLDSGRLMIFVLRENGFQPMSNLDGDNIPMCNSFACKVVGMGSIKIRTHDGKLCTLNEVRHVPHMTKNLISLSLWVKKGFSFKG
jgi:hypothetical protein